MILVSYDYFLHVFIINTYFVLTNYFYSFSSVRKLCQLVGWEQELDSLFRLGHDNSPEEDAIIKCCSGTATADDDGVIPSVIRNAHADIITSEDNNIV